MLLDNTLWGEMDKAQIAIDRIREFEPPEGYYVAFSGGKDSVVMLDLIKRAGVKHDAHYNLTTVDPPELVYFIREHYADVEEHRPKYTMWQLIEKYGLPTRLQRHCCKYLKEHGGDGRFCGTGVRWAESVKRSQRGMVELCHNKAKRYIHPIIDWSDFDVWSYIKTNNLRYCSLYDEGFHRLGCVLCPMGNDRQKKMQIERYPKIVQAYKRAANKYHQARVAKGKIFKDWKNGDDYFNWWLTGKGTTKETEGQERFFFD